VSRYSHSYRYTRTRTTPHDILRVLDDYVGRFGDALLDDDDLRRYRLFSLKDRSSRSVNALINNDRRQARIIVKELFAAPGLALLLTTQRGMLYAMIGCAAYALSLLPIGKAGRRVLHALKFG